jgi:hypothetical protein
MSQPLAWQKVFLVLVLSALFMGCGGGPSRTQAPVSQAPSTTDLLLQSGFQAEPIHSPTHLQKLPANHFVIVEAQGRTSYVYTDPVSNQLYFGSPAAYQRYRARAAEVGVAEAQQSNQQSMTPAEWKMYHLLYGGS